MQYEFPPDVNQLVRRHLATGCYPSEDALIREALVALEERNEFLADIQAGIDDMEHGRTRPLEDVAAEIRATLGSATRT